MREIYIYPVGDPIWLNGGKLHIPWSQYDVTLCGLAITDREEKERKSLSRQDKEVCERCEELNELVIDQFIELKRSER